MTGPDAISRAVQMACLLEVSGEKPGNITRRSDFNDSCFEDFIISAAAVGPAFAAAPRAGVGETILRAVQDTRRFVGVNTNLGIILMLAPLAKAAGLSGGKSLRRGLSAVLKGLSVEDAALAYEAIRLANPGGLGETTSHDAREKEVDITLYEAMDLAKNRDTLAKEYVTDFKVTFELGLPAFTQALGKGALVSRAVVHTFLAVLARVPDTLVARKKGLKKARKISLRAQQIMDMGGIFSPEGQREIKRFDLALRDEHHTLNPGTTADLIAAVLFVFLIENDMPPLNQGRYVLFGNPSLVQ